MQIALSVNGHWHTAMHAAAFRAVGAPLTLLHSGPAEQNTNLKMVCPELAALPRVYSLTELVAAQPDLVLVLGTPQDMLERTRFLIERGIAVAAEKPVGHDPAALDEVARLAQTRSAFVSVAQPYLLGDFWEQVPTDPGPLSHFHFRLINGSPQRYVDWGVPWVLDPAVAGGGALRNLGLHGLSAFLKLTGGEAQCSSATLSSVLYGLRGEEYANVSLRGAGAVGQVQVGYTLASDQSSEFEMTAHWRNYSVRDEGEALTVISRRTGEKQTIFCLPLSRRYELFARSTLAALRGEAAQIHTLSDHARAMRLADAAYAQAQWARP